MTDGSADSMAGAKCWTLNAVHVTVAVALLYSVGFTISNSHFARFELLRPEILRARYLAAAVLFMGSAALPSAVGVLLSSGLRRRPATKEDTLFANDTPAIRLGDSELWAIGCIPILGLVGIDFALYLGFLTRATVGGWGSVLPHIMFFAAATMATWYSADFALGGTHSGLAGFWPSTRPTMAALLVLMSGFVLPILFGQLIYGHVRPEYGGGAVWAAVMNSRDGTPFPAGASDTVVIIDRDERSVNVVACYRQAREKAPSRMPIAVAASEIAAVRLVRLVALDRLGNDSASWCE
jgi:hypothetical protein